MNQTTKETRRRSYDAVLPKRAARCRLILETLGNRELTASEITEELVAAGRIPYFNRNYVAPRLTELKEIGILTTVGRRKATRSDATEAVWARAEPSGPTGQTAAAYADNPTEAEQMTLGSATNPVATALYVTSDGNGELVVAEMVPQVPGQMNMDGTQQEAPKLLKLVQHG